MAKPQQQPRPDMTERDRKALYKRLGIKPGDPVLKRRGPDITDTSSFDTRMIPDHATVGHDLDEDESNSFAIIAIAIFAGMLLFLIGSAYKIGAF